VFSQGSELVPIRSSQVAGLKLLEDFCPMSLQDVDKSRRSLGDFDKGDGPGESNKGDDKTQDKEEPQVFHAFVLKTNGG
jgi:hypothetical protein